MNDFNQFKDKVRELVNAWNKVIKPGIEESSQYGETNTRRYLIDVILEALNWVDDGSKKIVDNEFAVKHKTGTGSADYALKINGVPKILLEAKDVAKVKDLENGYDTVHGIKRTYPRQLSNYCHDLNHLGSDIKFAILTNGKEWIVYNIQYADISSEREIVFRLDIEELDKTENLQKLWALEHNDFCGGYHRLREIIQHLHDYRLDIDKKAVQQLLECKDLLSSSIFNDYEKDNRGIKTHIDNILEDKEKDNGMPTFQEIPEEERLNFFIKESSSSIINKILFIRILEDKNFLTPKLTKRSIEKWKDFWGHKDYREIMNLFREACRVTENTYNGGLFRLNPYDKVEYDPNIIKKIIDILGEINFREIDSDIIGRIYEIYLGQVLKVESEIKGKKRTKYKADNKERKKLGQYYTPKFVVDFIVKNTLGKLIEGKKPEDVAKIRILDPACGSGSFLINVYDALTKYYEDWNSSILKKINEDKARPGINRHISSDIIQNYKNIILKENIHGVDLNGLSVQIAEINLWIRALERDKKLIKLNKNILNGNSLITGVEGDKELALYKAELEEIKQRTNEIKDYYEKNELDYGEKNKLKALELRLKSLKEKINTKLNENLKDYFGEHFNKVYAFNWEVEFPQVMEEGGFDVVIGNPPYFNIRTNPILQKYCKNEYPEIYTGQNDVLYYFVMLGINLLKEGGLFGFIVSRYFMEADSAKKFREFILKNSEIVQIIDFGNNQVFDGVNVLTSIIILKKRSKPKNTFFEVIKLPDGLKPNIISDVQKNRETIKLIKFSQNDLSSDIWTFHNKEIQNIISKIEKDSLPLGQIAKTGAGIQSGLNDVYVVSDETIRKFSIEKAVLRNYVKTQDLKPYHIIKRGLKVIRLLNEDNIEKYPNTKKYLQQNKNKLEKRYEAKKGICKWYSFAVPRNLDIFDSDKEKIITPIYSTSNKFGYDSGKENEKFMTLSDTAVIQITNPEYSTKSILAILNSSLLNFYYKKTKKLKRDGYFEYLSKTLEPLPIKYNRNFEKKSAYLADKMIILLNANKQIVSKFNQALSNQPISDTKSCTFARYFDSYELYDMQRETSGRINEIEAKILSLDVKEEGDKLVIYMTNYNEEQKKLWENIKAVTLTIKDNDIRKFLFFSIKKILMKKRGRGFGKGNLLELIKKIEVPVYIPNVKMNINKIKDVMKEFNHNTKDLWFKDESKKEKFNSLTEMEAEIRKTDKEIDEMVYKLYGLTPEEIKIVEGKNE